MRCPWWRTDVPAAVSTPLPLAGPPVRRLYAPLCMYARARSAAPSCPVALSHPSWPFRARPQRCPVMSAGPQYEYLWADGVKVKTPLKLSAPDYVNCLFDWVEDQARHGWPAAGFLGRNAC